MNTRNLRQARAVWWVAALLLLGVAGALCWSSEQPVQAGMAAACEYSEASPPTPKPLPPANPAAFNPLAGMSLEGIEEAARNLTPEAERMLNSLDVQFHDLYPSMALNGATVETSVSIQSSVCMEGMWAQIIMPAQLAGGAKFAHASKSPASVVDRLHDWVRFPFPAIYGTATAGIGLDGFAEGVYPFTWVIGYGDTVLQTKKGFLTVGGCCCGGASSTFSPESSADLDPLAGMSLEEIEEAARNLTPEAERMLSSLDVQFHDLYPNMALSGATVETSVSIQSSVCVEGMWAQIIMPAQLAGGAKFAHASKSPASVVDRLHDWVRFPFPAIYGTATAGIGLDGFAEGVYPFTWVIGYGDTVLQTEEGFLTIGGCCCGGASSALRGATSVANPAAANPAAFNPLAGMSLEEIERAAQALTPEAERMLSSLDVQFHNLYPSMALNEATVETSVSIQSSVCVEGMWAQIIMPAQLTGGAKFAHASKSPASVVDRLHDWVRFPFPAIYGTATAGIGLDGFAEGVYPFTWVIGYGDTVLQTKKGFLTVGGCCCGSYPTVTPSPSVTPSPTPVPVGECIQHSPGRVDVLMGSDQTIYREIEFNNTCRDTLVLDLGFSNLVSQIYLADGHDQIALASGERQVVRLYFTTGTAVSSDSTDLMATVDGVEVARIPISIGSGSVILPSAPLGELNGVNLLPGEVGTFTGTIKNGANVTLTITGTVPVSSSTWLSVLNSQSPTSQRNGQHQPTWELGPGDEGNIYFILQSQEEHMATARIYLESQYGDRQVIPVSGRFGPYADLAVLGSALPMEMVPGDAVMVTIVVVNPGPSEALTVTMPIAATGDAAIAGIMAGSGVTCVQEGTSVCEAPSLPAGEAITVAVKLQTLGVEQVSGLEKRLMAATLRVEVLAETYDPNSPNDVWVGIWGGVRVYLPLMVRD